MPAKNSIKTFVEGGYYHVYNRGVEKRDIFIDEQDYAVFLKCVKNLLTDAEDKDFPNYSNEIELIAYCLMPNHFHLFLKQKTADGMTKFVKSLTTRYAMYFNSKHERSGRVFQGSYKAVLVNTDEQLMHLSRYIHKNSDKIRRRYTIYPYSSYKYFLGKANAEWVKPTEVLGLFQRPEDYADFMSEKDDSKAKIGKVAID